MSYYVNSPPWRDYISGLYFNVASYGSLHKTYLPQIELQAHATILATTSRTTLTQTFINSSTEKGIREVRYTFPLYDGVSVVGFTCHVGDRTIVGEVKERDKARAVFKEAVAQGETAALLEQLPEASDVFTTTVGTIPPGAKVITKITYLGELKHDMEVDGIRFTIPNVICPRYGAYPGSLHAPHVAESVASGISITVDAEMADGSFIQKIQSPSHPIAISMGTLSLAPKDEPSMTKASAILTQGIAQLETDFILQIVAKNTGVPQAILENHPTIPNQRALMTTLVPRFSLPQEKPELVFVCDRSGSMSGSRITLVVQALKVFLKSLPVGVKFNICSFGSRYSFLWKRSMTYSQQTLDEAVRHAETFGANYGGTEMLKPLKATIEQRYKDMPLDVMLLTDGEIWNQQELFTYLNKSVTESKAPIRLFTLGIGNGVSHSLIEGVARAGDGFAQTVGEGEKMDTKVVRMLKGALSPHVKDYTLEVNYSKHIDSTDVNDDFEIVEKVTDSLKVQLDLEDEKRNLKQSMKEKIYSLFETSCDPDKEDPPAYDETGENKYAHLPKLAVPKILQAPHNIPSLFAFNRTTAYLLLGPDAPQGTPKSVVLRGTSTHGPLELEIPIHILSKPGESIHQLAAKKAISELEQGRGWLSEVKDQSGMPIKSRFEGRFEDMVEREAVRLGVQFQVGGKWCSFVAVETNRPQTQKSEKDRTDWEWLDDEIPSDVRHREFPQLSSIPVRKSRYVFDSESESEIDESALEAEIEENLDYLHNATKRLHKLGQAMSEEVDKQNAILNRISGTCKGCTDFPSEAITLNQSRLDRIGGGRGVVNPHELRKRSQQRSPPPDPYVSLPAPPTGTSRTGALQTDVDNTISVMRDTITRVTERGARLDTLQPKTDMLAHSAHSFRGQANKRKSAGFLGGLFGSSSSATSFHSQASQEGSNTSKADGGWFGGGGALFASRSSSSVGNTAFGGNPASPTISSATGSANDSAGQNPQALQDYQMQLMLLEQQNKKRLLMRREQATLEAPGSAQTPPAQLPMAQQLQQQSSRSSEQQPDAVSPHAFGTNASLGAAVAVPPPPTPLSDLSPSFGAGAADGLDLGFEADGSALDNFDFDSFLQPSGEDAIAVDTAGSIAPPPAPAPASASATNAFAPPKLFVNPSTTAPAGPAVTPEDLTHYLISLQTFEGSWESSESLLSQLQISEDDLVVESSKTNVDKKVFVTALVVAVFESKLQESEESWELVVDKAKGWLGDNFTGDIEDLVAKAKALVK